MSLTVELASVLPKDKKYEVFHFQSNPRDTHPLVSQKSNSTDLKTIKAEHFITLAHEGLIFFGIEIFIYITIDYKHNSTEKLLFVSKADTNGLNESNVKIGKVTQVILENLLQIPIETYLTGIIPKDAITPDITDKNKITKLTSTKDTLKILIERKRGTLSQPEKIKPYTITDYPKPAKTKISLFTRSEPQYLFPSSSKNPKKHVLGGDGLLKWWLKALDKIIVDKFEKSGLIAKLQIPAEDPRQIERYLKQLESDNWSVGDAFKGKDDDLAIFKIPLFPDDPKARFLEHLVVENRAKTMPLKQFWIELQARQEFRLGVTVSVIGIEGYLKPVNGFRNDSIQLSRRYFKKLKNYITGEDYRTSEGSIEAYKNVKNYLESQFDQDGLEIIGEYVPETKTTTVNTTSINTLVPKKGKRVAQTVQINTLPVRKKQKDKIITK